MMSDRRATDGGPNPDYSPEEDGIDAIAEHLREDDTAYAEGDEADRQAKRIVEALQGRGLQIVDLQLCRREILAEATEVVREMGCEFPQRMALCMKIVDQIVALMDKASDGRA